MSDEQKNTILRFAIIFLLIALGFVMVIAKIVYIQTVERDRWLAIADKQVAVNQPIKATRGNILDCHGKLLAGSMPQYYIYMDTRVPALHEKNGKLFQQSIDSLALNLSQVIGDRTPAEYKQLISKAYRNGNGRLKIAKHRINYLQRRQLEQSYPINLGKYKSGIIFEAQHRRIKPFGNLASRTIGGIYGENGNGNAGFEKQFDKQLRGVDGVSSRQRIGGRTEYVTIQEAEDGMDILTTIDIDLQDIAEKALRQQLVEIDGEWGCCMLMETHTGEVKAIANLDRTSDGDYYERENHAVTRMEPGSTFKTIALMVALDDGKVNIDDTVRVYKNGWTYFNAKHNDSHAKDTIYTIRSALAASSNIAMAKIITHSYEGSAKKFVNRIGKIGLLDSVYCEIPGAQKNRIDVPRDTVTLSKMSYGYSVEMSPIQIMMFYNAIANGGKMVRPMLVKEIQQNGETVKRYNTETVKSSICSSSTLRDIQGALHDVVWDNHLGTASVNPWGQRKAQSNLVHIAGKTGTAQLFINNRYTSRRHRLTFVGYFPEEDPQYTCICVISDPAKRGYYDAGKDCGTVVRKVAEKTMASTGCYVFDEDGNKVLERNRK